jgi:hypothetical protein
MGLHTPIVYLLRESIEWCDCCFFSIGLFIRLVKTDKQPHTFNYNRYRTVFYPLLNSKSFFLTGSDGCIYETLIPIYLNDTEKDHKVVSSLLLKTVVSGNARNGVALAILDQDHVAVLGPPLPASKGNSPIQSPWHLSFKFYSALLCLFFNWVVCLFVVDVWEVFLYYGY